MRSVYFPWWKLPETDEIMAFTDSGHFPSSLRLMLRRLILRLAFNGRSVYAVPDFSAALHS